MLLELGHQTEHTHDLGDPGAGDPLPPGYLGLVCAVYASPLIQTLAVSIPPTSPAIARQPLSAIRSAPPAAAPEVPASWTCSPRETDRVDPGPHQHERYTDDPASHHDIASSPRPARPRPLETDRLRPIGRTVPFRDVTAITSRPFVDRHRKDPRPYSRSRS